MKIDAVRHLNPGFYTDSAIRQKTSHFIPKHFTMLLIRCNIAASKVNVVEELENEEPRRS
jgi:hypothetical protein